eukprot:scaffold310170_cov75-Attheya_sp.AAC.1
MILLPTLPMLLLPAQYLLPLKELVCQSLSSSSSCTITVDGSPVNPRHQEGSMNNPIMSSSFHKGFPLFEDGVEHVLMLLEYFLR